jgi:hypothetical protein
MATTEHRTSYVLGTEWEEKARKAGIDPYELDKFIISRKVYRQGDDEIKPPESNDMPNGTHNVFS